MKKSNKLFVVISIIVLILIIGIVFAYLFLATDTFKSKQELFAKYFGQNIEVFQKITNSQTVDTYKNLDNENKYEANTNIKLVHSEGGEISNPFNNLSAVFDVQKNNEQQYMYANGKIMYGEEEFFETEIIKEQDVYGVRFTDLVKQFVSINKNGDTEATIEDIGVEQIQLQTLIDLNTQISVSKDKYKNIITKTIENGVFEKSAINKMNAYSVLVSSENVENMLIEILNNLKNEEQILQDLETFITKEEIINNIDEEIRIINEEIEVPTIKITVYEENRETIKTEIEIGVYKFEIENVDEDKNITTKIKYLDGEQSKQYDFEINKKNSEGQESFEIVINGFEGEEEYQIKFSSLMHLLDNNQIKLEMELSQLQAITKASIVIENTINVGNDFEKTQTLTSENNMLLNDLDEESRTKIINYLKDAVSKNINENLDLLKVKLGLKNEEVQNQEQENETEMSQVDINKFNAKFEFYTGDEVSAENVKTLLDIVKNNLKSYENIEVNPENTTNSTKEKINIKLNIEKDTINETIVNEIIQKIGNNKKYKVSIHYNETNNLIDYITIAEV